LDPDIKLILEFTRGETSAFEQILKKYKSLVTNTAYCFIQNHAEAEDIAQEVFLKVYNSAKRYKARAKFSTWIYKITANICLNTLRSKKHLQTVSLDTSIITTENKIMRENLNSTHVHPHLNLEKEEFNQLIKKAISSLPGKQRMTVILQKYEGLSYLEISEIMGCSIPAVDSLLQRAKQNLKRKLVPYFKISKKDKNEGF